MPKRRSHTPEFKAKVALDALTSKKTLAEVAADHNLHPVQVCQWKRQAVKHLADLFRHSNLTYDAEPAEQLGLQLARLEQANASLREELEWLKKNCTATISQSCAQPWSPIINASLYDGNVNAWERHDQAIITIQ